MTRAFVKVVNVSTMEIRLLKLSPAVERMLVAGEVHWGRRRHNGKTHKVDLLIVENEDVWVRLLPYFSYELEKETMKKHRERVLEEVEND